MNGIPGGPDRLPLPKPAIGRSRPSIRTLYVVGDYLFESTLNGVLDSADTVVDELVEAQTDAAAASPALVLPALAGPA